MPRDAGRRARDSSLFFPSLLFSSSLSSSSPRVTATFLMQAHVSPTRDLSDEAFTLYSTLIVWLAVVTSGLGSEMVLGEGRIRRTA